METVAPRPSALRETLWPREAPPRKKPQKRTICPNVEATWMVAVGRLTAGRKANGPRMIHAIGTRPSKMRQSAIREPAVAAPMLRTPQPASVVIAGVHRQRDRDESSVQPVATTAAALTPNAATAEAMTNKGMSKTATATGSRYPRVASRTLGETKTAIHQERPTTACMAKYARPHPTKELHRLNPII